MPNPLSRLCATCETFEVKELLLAAENSPDRGARFEHEVLQGVSKFFELQSTLKSLKRSAAECSLCDAVWREYARQCRPFELEEDALNADISNGPIYLETLDWDRERSKWPYVVAMQYDPVRPQRSSRRLACFEVCANYDDMPMDGRVLAQLQAKSANDERCFRLANEWLQTCLRHHDSCHQLSTQFFPTRVLDVNFRSDCIRLVDGSGRRQRYAALSYCWGDQRDILLRQDNSRELREGVLLSRLPATLRDAVTVTRKLGIDYLWIDAMCIFQDHKHLESLQDWTWESSRMRDVYNGAVVTIEAAAASRADKGFLFNTRQSSQPYCGLRWSVKSDTSCPRHLVYLRPMLDITDKQLLGTRIYTRGWTLQERLLAPRTLAFGEQQISFECSHGFFDEAGKTAALARIWDDYLSKDFLRQLRRDRTTIVMLLRSLSHWLRLPAMIVFRLGPLGNWYYPFFGDIDTASFEPRANMSEMRSYFTLWRDIVSRFSERLLTDPKDRLPAIAGLAQEFEQTLGDTYVAGMWKSDLIESLAWRCRDLFNSSGPAMGYYDNSLGTYVNSIGLTGINPELYASGLITGTWPYNIRTAEYVAPSWSWASVKGKISYSHLRRTPQTLDQHAKIMDVQTESEGGNRLGRLTGGYLTISAPFLLIPAPHEPCSADFQLKTWHDITRTREIRDGNSQAAVTEYWQHYKRYTGQTFGLIQLFTATYTSWGDLRHDKRYLTLLLVQSMAGSHAYGRLCCHEWRLSKLEDTEMAWLSASAAKENDTVSDELCAAPWIKQSVTLV